MSIRFLQELVVALVLITVVHVGVLRAEESSQKTYSDGTKPKYVRYGFTPNDPLYTGGQPGNTYGQWHLNGNNGYPNINVTGAWNANYTGSGVIIGIVDDCIETAHPDLNPNYNSDYSYNFGSYIGQDPSDPNPRHTDDQHGISVAGVAAAYGGNGKGVTGVAPRAGLAGLRIDFPEQTSAMFADATTWRTDVIKVKNHSYGISKSYIDDPTTVIANRIAAADGCVNIRAAGNDSANANAKSAQSDRTAISVAALGADGTASYYSNFGACVFVTAPSNGGGPGITTTDRTGSDGYGGITGYDDYTSNFGGTSSASPTVAGVVALILEANPNLDVRGVKHVLAETSTKVDPTNSNWQTNGAGYNFNPYYGFGLVDATAAVNYAATYSAPGDEMSFGTDQITVGEVLVDIGSPVVRTFTLTDTTPLESIEVDISLSSDPYWGDYNILLTSPFGTTSQLGYKGSGGGDYGMTEWEFSSAEFWGENPYGQWSLSIQDDWEYDEATWESFEFTGYTEIPAPELLIGDANHDGIVSAEDYASVQANFSSTGVPGIPGDANGDGVVSAGDYSSVQANFGNVAPTQITPEPATLSLLVISGLVICKRRSKILVLGGAKT